MAKAKSVAAPTPAAATAKRTAASEIDDIFSTTAKKPKLSADSTAANGAAGVTGEAAGTAKKSQKKGKGKADDKDGPAAAKDALQQEDQKGEAKPAPARRVPVEVVDTSKTIESYKPEAAPPVKVLGANATEAERKAAEEEERFMDSRGTRKKTEDGLPIYDEAELRIGLGGGTELCPFDCDCCF
ncbi:hypothetical protein JCM11251_006047 [Rhodosporidiobolus azoricus]